MNKFVVAGDWTIEKVVGVQRFAYQILLELDRLLDFSSNQIEIELLVPCNSSFVAPFHNIKIIKTGYIRKKIEKHIWQQWTFPRYVKSKKAKGVDLALALPLWGCDICAIHDCILEAFPEGFQDHKLFRWIYVFKAKQCSIRKKRRIITGSYDAKKEIQKYYNIEEDRISVIGNGWNHMDEISEDVRIFDRLPNIQREQYFFSLGSKYKHKNFAWILKTAEKNPQYQFVVSGEDSYTNNSENLRLRELSNVTFTGYLKDGELKALMKYCRAFIQPSFYEGFGIPPLEALSLGKKIIVANTSCLPEIYQDTAYYIDPYSDGCDLDTLLSASISQSCEVLQKYTWEQAASRFMKVLEEMVD